MHNGGHQTHSYPASKMLPKGALQRLDVKRRRRLPPAHQRRLSPTARRVLKHVHTKRGREWGRREVDAGRLMAWFYPDCDYTR